MPRDAATKPVVELQRVRNTDSSTAEPVRGRHTCLPALCLPGGPAVGTDLISCGDTRRGEARHRMEAAARRDSGIGRSRVADSTAPGRRPACSMNESALLLLLLLLHWQPRRHRRRRKTNFRTSVACTGWRWRLGGWWPVSRGSPAFAGCVDCSCASECACECVCVSARARWLRQVGLLFRGRALS